jgi:DNA invertase Pin-like site-specific DNA recombinase
MTNAFAYLRVSGRGQIEGDGFTRQMDAIRRYARDHDIRIAKVFREEGVSGTKDLANRPALGALLRALHGDGIRLVLVERLDRLARDLIIQETIMADMRKYGFEIVSVSEPDLCSNDPSRKLMRQIFGAIAEYEKTVIVLKLSGARARKRAKEGRCEGRKPYGYYEGEQVVLDRMKALRTSGMAYDKIAETLNADGLRPRSGEKWYAGVVQRIMKAKAPVQSNTISKNSS